MFKDRRYLTTHWHFIRKCDTLAKRMLRASYPRKYLKIDDIDSDVGHIIIHFLATGQYQCLEPQSSSKDEKTAAEFLTALQAYSAAESLNLPSLSALAEAEIFKSCETLNLHAIVCVIEESALPLSQCPRLAEYLESRFLYSAVFSAGSVIDKLAAKVEAPQTVSDVLLKALVVLNRKDLRKPTENKMTLWKMELYLKRREILCDVNCSQERKHTSSQNGANPTNDDSMPAQNDLAVSKMPASPGSPRFERARSEQLEFFERWPHDSEKEDTKGASSLGPSETGTDAQLSEQGNEAEKGPAPPGMNNSTANYNSAGVLDALVADAAKNSRQTSPTDEQINWGLLGLPSSDIRESESGSLLSVPELDDGDSFCSVSSGQNIPSSNDER
ncbi:hypothetical protein NW762_010869 [Fusarium torreyae]|uniref:BTB domain-containing protein n=1 Tax=Fusarium torreyae TaxID=1237075 RepID=A0A9W8RU23_9HYPO|nr:hypothetical protein NW762_010869 [Fusarium torreyae]